MPAIDSYSAATTSITYAWPESITGIERIILSAQADLQRMLSALFNSPIVVALVYANTLSVGDKPTAVKDASADTPLIQKRQVHILCSSTLVCKATSTVKLSSPEAARLFCVEKYAIGQCFRELGKVPRFELLEVGNKGHALWRRYRVDTEGFECEILEEFPDRRMFVHGLDVPEGVPLKTHRLIWLVAFLLVLVFVLQLKIFSRT